MQVPLANIFCNDAENRAEIGWAEKVQMVQKLVEVVEVAAVFVVWLKGTSSAVCFVELWREAAEELGHCEVGFCVTNVGGWVDEHCFAVGAAHYIAAPEVAMQEAWFLRFHEEVFEMIQELCDLGSVVRAEI